MVFKLSAFKRAAIAVAISVPAGVFVPAALGVGATAAHASAAACIDILPGTVHGAGNILNAPPALIVSSGQCPLNTDNSQAAINVCNGGTDNADPSGTVGLTDANNAGTGVEAWVSTTGLPTSPSGEAEVDNIGISSEQQGC